MNESPKLVLFVVFSDAAAPPAACARQPDVRAKRKKDLVLFYLVRLVEGLWADLVTLRWLICDRLPWPKRQISINFLRLNTPIITIFLAGIWM